MLADDLSSLVMVALLLVGLAVSAVVYYQQIYRPAIRIEEKYLGIVLNNLFNVLVSKYRAQHPGDYELRDSLMRIRRRWPWRRAFFRVDFTHGGFSAAELEQEYRLGAGNAGAALLRREQTLYDSLEAHEHRLGLTATQREITAHVNSILSTPVFRPEEIGGAPIADLNLDSSDPIRVSGFRNTGLQEIALHYAETIGALVR